MLTARQRAVVLAIDAYQREHGRSPQFRELTAVMGRKSTGALYRMIKDIEMRGAIRRHRVPGSKTYAIEIVRPLATRAFRFDDATKALVRLSEPRNIE